MTRRDAMRKLSLFLAGSPLLRSQQDMPYTAERHPAIESLVNVFEFEPVCRNNISKQNYDFIAGGVDNEWTLRRNRSAFDRITLRPRMLRDVSKLDLSLTLFGQRIESPILIAPTAGHQLAHKDGELATARAAAERKTILCVSNNSSYPIDKIVAAAPNAATWFQLYAVEDRETTRERVERALDAGCKLVCLTVDTQYNSHRERLLRNQISGGAPPSVVAAARRQRREPEEPIPYGLRRQYTATLTWEFFDELKSYSRGLPVIIKGILTAEDAKLAVEHKADGIIVSNHGGRYLEATPATIDVLGQIVDAVEGKIPVLVDSGFRRGTDILKALAIGAKAIMVGRPPLWGLGAYGQEGVARVLEVLESELALAMGLSGRPNLASIDRTLIHVGQCEM